MPYIEAEMRVLLDKTLFPLCATVRQNIKIGAGGLNFIITKLLLAWLGDEPKYADYNAAIGVLECCKLELYRRKIIQYEERKRKENGDLY